MKIHSYDKEAKEEVENFRKIFFEQIEKYVESFKNIVTTNGYRIVHVPSNQIFWLADEHSIVCELFKYYVHMSYEGDYDEFYDGIDYGIIFDGWSNEVHRIPNASTHDLDELNKTIARDIKLVIGSKLCFAKNTSEERDRLKKENEQRYNEFLKSRNEQQITAVVTTISNRNDIFSSIEFRDVCMGEVFGNNWAIQIENIDTFVQELNNFARKYLIKNIGSEFLFKIDDNFSYDIADFFQGKFLTVAFDDNWGKYLLSKLKIIKATNPSGCLGCKHSIGNPSDPCKTCLRTALNNLEDFFE